MTTAIRQPLVGVSLAAVTGIFLSPALSSWGWLAGSLGALALWRFFGGTLWILLATAGVFGCLHRLQTVESPGALLSHSLTEPFSLWQGQGVVIKTFRSFRGTTSLFVRTEQLRSNSKVPIPVRVLLSWRGESPSVGSRVRWTGILQPAAAGPHRIAKFDRRAWLSSQGVYLEFRKIAVRETVHPPSPWHPTLWAAAARKRAEQAISRGIESEKQKSALIRSLTLGADKEAEKMLAEAFRHTGTYHIFSVSGLHVGMVAAIAWQTFKVLRIPRSIALPTIIPLLFAYAGVTGLKPPAFRAACMAAIFLGGTFSTRRAFVLNSLAAAALFVLAWDSKQLFRVGFQLSFVVVTAIACLSPPLYRLGQRFFAPDPFLPRLLFTPIQRLCAGLGNAFSATMAVSIAAWLGSTPLLLWHFRSVSLSALLVNPLVVPLAFLVLSLAAVSLICDVLISHWLATIFNHANLLPASAILSIVQWTSHLPGGFISWTEPSL